MWSSGLCYADGGSISVAKAAAGGGGGGGGDLGVLEMVQVWLLCSHASMYI